MLMNIPNAGSTATVGRNVDAWTVTLNLNGDRRTHKVLSCEVASSMAL